jgi:hypothetical protein
MKFIVFASSLNLKHLSNTKDVQKFIDNTLDFHVMTLDGDEMEYIKGFKKVERYGSFMFISEDKYNQLLPHSDD